MNAELAAVLREDAANNGPPAGVSAIKRLEDSRVDLLELIDNGLPQRARVPGSPIWHRGKRHLFAAQAKSGKSLFALAHGVDVVAAGGRVAILDRENGAEEYARRLSGILGARNGTTRERVAEGLSYYAWPTLSMSDGADEAFVSHVATNDVVVFDASRPWLSVWGLKENESDDYAQFMAAMIDPLARAGIAVVVLDNTGHDEQGRARGSSSKLDLHDLTFNVRQTRPFDEHRVGKLQVTPQLCRFSPGGPWEMQLGGNVYSAPVPVEPVPVVVDEERLAVITELLRGGVPRSLRWVEDELRKQGLGWRGTTLREAMKAWAADPSTAIDEVEGRYVVLVA